jgi:hypothetical protein
MDSTEAYSITVETIERPCVNNYPWLCAAIMTLAAYTKCFLRLDSLLLSRIGVPNPIRPEDIHTQSRVE